MRTYRPSRSPTAFRYSPLVAALACALAPLEAPAVTYTVTSAADTVGTCPGPSCTLRTAVQAANTNCPADPAPLINFNIAGTGPFVIAAASSLSFSCFSLAMAATIDGTTQPGYQPTTNPTGFNSAGIQIVLDGTAIYGGNIISANPFPYGNSLTIIGLEIRNRASGTALSGNLRLQGSHVHGNSFGIDPYGFSATNRSTIGGGALTARNLIRNNSVTGIDVSYGGYVDIVNNLIGTDASGGAPSPNGEAIVLESATDVSIQQNYISGNNSSGIRVTQTTSAPPVSISQNKIGPLPAGGTAANSTGVKVESSTVHVLNNVIAGNADNGVRVYETFGSSQALISQNSIDSNGLKNIDLDFAGGPLPNDALDADTGPNGRQNHPVITSVLHGGGNTSVAWSLDSEASGTYALQFFSNASPGVRAGLTYLQQSPNVFTNGAGNVTGVEVIPGLHVNISATAINQSNNHTSEFSPAAALTATPAVTVSPNPLNFPNTVVGSSSGPNPVTVTSTGAAPYIINQFDSAPSCYGGPICATGAFTCSNTCTTSTPYATSASCNINVTFTPGVTGPHSTTFYICDNASGSPRAVTLSGIGIAPPPPTITPPSHSFGGVEVGTSSAVQSFTVNNPSPTSVTLSAFGVTGPYQIASTTCGASLAPGASCAVDARFLPVASGPANGVLSATASSGPVSANLSGNGTPSPTPTLTPPSIDFGAVQLGGQSGPGTFTLTNPSLLPVTLSAFSVTAPFNLISTTCTTSLPASASCTADVRFVPAAVGPATGTISNATGNGTVSAGLAGNGSASPPPTIAPVSHDFGATFLGTSSAPHTFTINNPGLVPLALSTMTVTPPFALVSTTCGASLPANSSCALGVKFAPTALGLVTGNVSGTAGANTVSAALSGTGAAAPLLLVTPPAFDFGPVQLGANSAPHSFAVKNPGPITVSLQPIAISGPFQLVSTTCAATLASLATCEAVARFIPLVPGAASGSLTATSNFGSSSASLTGNGVRQPAVSLPTDPIDFGSFVVGEPRVTRQVRLTNTGNDILGIHGIQVGAPFTLVNGCGVSLAAGDSCTVTVEFNPTEVGEFTATLTVNTNAPNAGSIQIRVEAQVQARPEPLVRVSPRSIGFGGRMGGTQSPAERITITNEGGRGATLELTLNSPHFQLINTSCGPTLAPQSTCFADVAFGPQGFGPRRGQFVVTSNAPDSPIGVELSGAGCRPVMVTQGRGTPLNNCAP